MELGIAGRTAVVTAAGGGLGAAAVQALLAEGARVIACDISAPALAALAASAVPSDALTTVVCDLADQKEIGRLADRLTGDDTQVDILVNITGGPPPSAARDATHTQWEEHFSAMVSPVLHLAQRIVPGMCDRNWGRIVTSTSSGVVQPIPNLAVSNGLRMSLLGWSKTLASEVARFGVTSNIVIPGRIATRRIHALNEAKANRDGTTVDEVSAASIATIPADRYGRPEEFGDLVAFLASDRAGYITGSSVRVDGGLINAV